MDSKNMKTHFPFWKQLTPPQKKFFTQSIQEIYMPKNDLWISTPSQCKGVILVKNGNLRVYILSENGREITLFNMKEGDLCVLSASCLLENFTFPLHIVATEDTVVYSINQNSFGQLADENVYVENFIYKIAISRFSQIMWIIQDILFTKIDRRLAQYILQESEDSLLFATHEDIARNLGTAREVVSRMLKYFSQEKWIQTKRGQIEIINRPALKNL